MAYNHRVAKLKDAPISIAQTYITVQRAVIKHFEKTIPHIRNCSNSLVQNSSCVIYPDDVSQVAIVTFPYQVDVYFSNWNDINSGEVATTKSFIITTYAELKEFINHLEGIQ